MIEFLQQPWPWYVAGPLIGLVVPLLLLVGNKSLGISSSLRDICAACLPARLPFFQYDWRQEQWRLWFVGGILVGGILAGFLLPNPHPLVLNPQTVTDLQTLGIRQFDGLLPADLFSTAALFSVKGLLFSVLGGLLVGFGTRWAGGCTSGHTIFGLSTLQWPSLVATICFMVGGLVMTHLLLPFLLAF